MCSCVYKTSYRSGIPRRMPSEKYYQVVGTHLALQSTDNEAFLQKHVKLLEIKTNKIKQLFNKWRE
jgi:hypothetical protein